MKKSLLLGAALAIAFAGNAKEAVHVDATNATVAHSVVKVANRNSNVQIMPEGREISKVKTAAALKGTKATVQMPIAYYQRPAGTLYAGLSIPSMYNFKYSHLMIPAFTEIEWTNTSIYGTDQLWEYCTGDNGEDYIYAESDEDMITTPGYPASSYPAPNITSSNVKGESTFQTTEYLGSTPYAYFSNIGEYVYNTNLRPDADMIAYHGATMLNNPEASESLDGRYGFTDAGYENVQLKAVGELFKKPIKPFLLSSFVAHLCDLNRGAAPLKVKATIYPVTLDENNEIIEFGEPLYEAEGDAEENYASERQWQIVVWNDVTVKDETGRPADFIVDQDIFIQLEAIDENTSFAQYIWNSPSVISDTEDGLKLMDDVYSYVVATADKGGETHEFTLPIYGAWYMDDNVTIGAMNSFPIQILSETYYLYTPDTEFIAATDTQSSKTFEIESWYSYEAWSLYAEDENGEEVDWIEYNAEDVMSGDAFTGVVKATFTVDALPEGVAGREANIEISYYGATLNIHVQQGESGVKDVEVKSAQYVNVVGNDFVVKATNDVTKAEVYTAAGVKVAEAAVNGTATINAAGLAHGVYFVKLNNGKTVKVVK